MRSPVFLFALMVLLASPVAALDLDEVAEWGPPTAVDTLTLRLTEARWQMDAASFDEIKSRFWQTSPHDPKLLDEIVLWYRDRVMLNDLLGALAVGAAEEEVGLEGLTQEDLLFLEASALVNSGRISRADAVLERLLSLNPAHPNGLVLRCWCSRLAPRSPDRNSADVRAALSEPEAAVKMMETLVCLSPSDPDWDSRTDALFLLAERPPRPKLAAILLGEVAKDKVRRGPLTLESFTSILRQLHDAHPNVFFAYFDDLLRQALIWLPPHELCDVLSLWVDSIPPAKYAVSLAQLQLRDELRYEAYRTLLAAPRFSSGLPDPLILQNLPVWHPDPAEAERWARSHTQEDLQVWDDAISVLRDRGQDSAADSLRAEVAREFPFAIQVDRLWDLFWHDPGGAYTMLDSLVAQLGERRLGWALLQRAESMGDHDFLQEFEKRHGPYVTLTHFFGAVIGVTTRGDGARLADLFDHVRTRAPGNTIMLRELAQSSMTIGNLELAEKIVEDLASRPSPPPDVAALQLGVASRARALFRVEELLEELADEPGVPASVVSQSLVFAESAGRSDLADRLLAKLEQTAPDSRQVLIDRARLLRARGDLEGARNILTALREDWPGAGSVRDEIEKAGGAVAEYEDSTPDLDANRLGGLDFDFDSTDWINTRRAGPDEFSNQEYLILQDRSTFYHSSRTRIVKRFRTTVELLSETAAMEFTTVRIPFLSDLGPPRLLCARTIDAAGAVREVSANQVLVTAHEGEEADVGDLRDLVIPFAGLKKGVVVDYAYEEVSPPYLEKGQSWIYHFGNFVPQREEILEVLVAPGVEHRIFAKHEPKSPEHRDLNGADLYRWRVADLSALPLEEQAPFEALMPDWVGVTTFEDWNEVTEAFGRFFWDRAEATDETRRVAESLVAGAENDEERAQRLFIHVQEEIDNIGIELGPGRLIPTPSHEVLSRGYGDCKDKVAALVALARDSGLDCLPVMVGTRPSPVLEEDFPLPVVFDHLIAFFPGIAGGTFADPTLGLGCLSDLPQPVAGQSGLLVQHDGTGDIVQIPELSPDLPELEMEVDLYPEPNGTMRAETAIQLRNTTSAIVEGALQYPDTMFSRGMVNIICGNRLNENMSLATWSWREVDCSSIAMEAVFYDSSWAGSDVHDASLVWAGSTDLEVSIPEDAQRTLPVEFPAAESYKLILRAHQTPEWRLSTRLSPISLTGPGFHGEVQVREERDGDNRRLEIRRDMAFTQRVYNVEEFLEVRKDYYGFLVAAFQAIEYQREVDKSRLAKIREYCRDHPDDLAFAFQAAQEVLGGDMGGDGEAGAERRAVARDLLAPVLADPETGSLPFLISAVMATTDGRFLRADSITTAGLERSPQDPYLIALAAQINRELGRDKKVVEYLRRSQAVSGEAASYPLIQLLLAMGEDREARREEERLFLIASEVDSVQLVSNKISGYQNSNRIEQVDTLLAVAERILDPFIFRLLQSDIAAREYRWDDAIELLEPLLDESPLNPLLTNNMAWYLACADRDLDRAEYLARMAIALEQDSATADNTLGLVLMRQKKWDEAMDLLSKLVKDERPGQRLANGYLLGLCHWLQGDRDLAATCWRSLEDSFVRDTFADLIRETLTAVDAGQDPSWLYLWPPREDQ